MKYNKIAKLGIDISPKESNRIQIPKDFSKSSNSLANKAGKFVYKQLNHPGITIEPIPKDLTHWFSENAATLDQVVDHLAAKRCLGHLILLM